MAVEDIGIPGPVPDTIDPRADANILDDPREDDILDLDDLEYDDPRSVDEEPGNDRRAERAVPRTDARRGVELEDNVRVR
jgi:hypothetical protein